MPTRLLAASLTAVALLSVACIPSVVAGDRRAQLLPSGSVMEIETFVGAPKWRLLPHLFSEKTVNVTCPRISVSISACHSAVHAHSYRSIEVVNLPQP